MNNFFNNNLPIHNIIEYGTIVLGVIIAIIIAKIMSEIVGGAVKKASFIKKAFKKIDISIKMELIGDIVAKCLYFIIIFIGVVGILKYFDINIILLDEILDNFLPKAINAIGLAIIAWFLATIAKTTIAKTSETIKINKKINSDVNISDNLGIIAYWGIIIYFLPQILEKLGQNELLKPITNIIDSIAGYIPNIIGAVIIFILGLFIARILKQITISILDSIKVDKASKKIGLKDFSVSKLAGTIIYVIILLPVAIQSLDKLQIEVISSPATEMLKTMINIVPMLLTASIIIVISYFIGKFIYNLIKELLGGTGFDNILKLIGLKNINSETKPSDIIGKLAFIYIMLLALIEASNTIGFTNISYIINKLIDFATNILIGIVILGVGLYLANFAERAIKSAYESKILVNLVKTAIIILTSFMGLQQMGIGGEIINQAFTLIIGAIAVAFALAVGLGSKEVAGEEVKKLLENLRK